MTQLVGIDAWVDTILGRLNGAEPNMVKTEVENTIRDFFLESTVWRVDLFITLEAGTALYSLEGLVAGARPLFVYEVFYYDRPVRPVADLPFDREFSGDPHSYWSPEPGQIRLSPIPNKDETRALRIVLSLQPTGCEVPEFVKDQFFGGILDGTLARIYFHPKRPYTSPSLGDLASRSYKRQVARARAIAKTRFTPAPHSFRYPQGWSPIV